MFQFRDEHGRHAIERGAPSAATVCSTASGSKPSQGSTLAAACVMAASTQHHAEAVIHGYGNAHPILGREPQTLPTKKPLFTY
jgi:hypothetical protein